MSEIDYTFYLNDADGVEHKYYIEAPHPPLARASGAVGGLRLINRIYRAAGGPIAELVESNLGKIIDLALSGAQDIEKPSDILDHIDLDDLREEGLELPTAFDAFITAMERIDIEITMRSIFFKVLRDGQSLYDEQNFNYAYRRNFWELYQAAWEVCRWNGFFGSLGTLLNDNAKTDSPGESK